MVYSLTPRPLFPKHRMLLNILSPTLTLIITMVMAMGVVTQWGRTPLAVLGRTASTR